MDTRQTPGDGFFSKQQTAAYLSLSVRTIDNLIARGELTAFRVTRKLLFRKRDLDALVERHRIGADLERIADEAVREVLGK